MIKIRKAEDRGHAELGWLDTYHTFSFADYHDPHWMGFRSLRVINDDLIMPSKGFGTHPHRNMEILTYVLSGSLAHKDSTGNQEIIGAGEFQYMSAGTGIEHSEFNPSPDEATHLLQIWIVPDEGGVTPRYEGRSRTQKLSSDLHLLASKTGRNGSIAIHQDADVYLAPLTAHAAVSHILQPGRAAWIQVTEGDARLNGIDLKAGDGAAVTNETQIQLTGITNARVLLFDLK